MLKTGKEQPSWFPIIGMGTKVPASKKSLPQPDVMVKEHPPTGRPVSDDALVLFEVLSPGNKGDQAWRRKVYASVPNCEHYVTVSLKTVEVVAYDRANRWKGTQSHGPWLGPSLCRRSASPSLSPISTAHAAGRALTHAVGGLP